MGCDQLGANGESEMPVRGGWGRVTIAVILFLAGGYFALTAGRAIDIPGLQYDEILFMNAATGEPTNGLFVRKRVLGVPVMFMTYMGPPSIPLLPGLQGLRSGHRIVAEDRENFVVWAASFRLTPVLDRTLVSPAGTTIFEVYWLDGRRT